MTPQVTVIVAGVLALAATIAALILIVPASRREKLHPFLQFIHDLCNFKFLLLEKILQVLYVLSTAFVIFYGFFLLFGQRIDAFYGSQYVATFGQGLVTMLLGPILVRVVYESLMLMFLGVKNLIEINKKMPGTVEPEQKPTYMKKTNYVFCSQCGTRYDEKLNECPSCHTTKQQ